MLVYHLTIRYRIATRSYDKGFCVTDTDASFEMASSNDYRVSLRCKPEYSAYSLKPSTARFILSLQAPQVNEEKRAPISVSLVLDRSSSMCGSKLDLVKQTSSFLLSQLNQNDRLGVVVYDGNVRSAPNACFDGRYVTFVNN